MDGIFILDKDSTVFSRTAGWHVAKIFGEKKFGHIGTLDPMATGVLPIVIGNATKMIPFIEDIMPNKKEYLFGMKFGVETDSLDITGKTIGSSDFVPSEDDIKTIDGFGDITAHNVYDYFQNENLRETTLELSKLVTIEYPEAIDTSNSSIAGLTFVITGEVNHFANRDELKEKIESLGGKTSGSVSAKTSYLINNDINSTSSKNKDAKAKGIPIITEEEFLKLIGE